MSPDTFYSPPDPASPDPGAATPRSESPAVSPSGAGADTSTGQRSTAPPAQLRDVLLIESLPDVARQVASALGRLGLHVEVCHSLPEVARRAAAVRVDGALVGLDLARVEDYALLRQLAYGFSRRLPLWLLATDTPTSADRLACQQHGVGLIELGPTEGRGGSAALPWITQTLALHLKLEDAARAAHAATPP